MMVVLDGHADRLEIRTSNKDYREFRDAVNAFMEVVGRNARFFRFSIRPPHFFDIPPKGALFRLRSKLTLLPCCYEGDLYQIFPIVGGLLVAEKDEEALWVCTPILEPQVEVLAFTEPMLCRVTLYPLPITFLLPYPIPDFEFTEDLEQMLPVAQVGGVSADLEGIERAHPDALAMVYRGYLRYYLRQMSSGLRLFLSRIVLFHALNRKDELQKVNITSAVTAPSTPLVSRLMAIADTPELKWERIIAQRLLYDVVPDALPPLNLRSEIPNINEINLITGVLRQQYCQRR